MADTRRSKINRPLLAAAIVFVAAVCGIVACTHGRLLWAYWNYAPREGDIVFQSLPRAPLINAIEGATQSPWSHCGLVGRDPAGNWVVYEACGNVAAISLRAFIMRSREGRFAVYRLTPPYQQHIPAMLREVPQYLGRPYDIRYRLDDERIYCSELVYKAYLGATGQPLGRLVRLGDLKWQPYEALITQIEQGPVPLDREMITPRDLAEAPELSLVFGER